MPFTPQQLKEKLLNSLDKNQHVVDVKTVLEVIKILEKYPISRQQLESTRLGRIVNDIRKQTTDKDIAKRAKNLVRGWQLLVGQQPSASAAASPQISTPQISVAAASPALASLASTPSSSRLSSPSVAGSSAQAFVVNGTHSHIVNKTLDNVGPSRMNGLGSQSLPGYHNGRLKSGSRLSPSLSVPDLASKIHSAESSPHLLLTEDAELKRSQTIPRGLNDSLGKLNNGYRSHSSHPSTPELVSTTARQCAGSASKQRHAVSDAQLSDSKVNSSKSSANRSQSIAIDKTSHAGVSKQLKSSFPAATVEILDKNNVVKNKHKPSQSVQETGSHKLEQHEVFMISDASKLLDKADSLKLKIKRAKTLEASAATSYATTGKISHTAGKNGVLNSSISEVNKTLAVSGRHTPTSSNPIFIREQSTASSGRTASPALSSDLSRICEQSTASSGRTASPAQSLDFSRIREQSTASSGRTASPALSSDLSRVRRPDRPVSKVATTSELIQKLYSGGNLRIVASETLERIATNRINRERDSSSSVVPAGIKSKSAKNKPIVQDTSLPPGRLKKRSRVNDEVDGRYQSSLETSSVAMSGSLLNLIRQLDREPTAEEITAATPVSLTTTESASSQIKLQPAAAQSSSSDSQTSINVPPVDPSQLLPPLDPDNIDWNSLEYEAPDLSLRPPISDSDVDRLHNDHWSFVNGQYDYRNEWHDWTRTYSMNSYEGMLHILPYVNINE